ncbi:hypothetical protein P9112_012034 [Eukaryota sp. TZLM1-RC]
MSKLNSLQTKVIQLKHTITTYQNYCKSHNLPLPQVSDVFFAPDTLQKVSNAFSLRSDLNDLRHDINAELTSIESQLQSSLSLTLSSLHSHDAHISQLNQEMSSVQSLNQQLECEVSKLNETTQSQCLQLSELENDLIEKERLITELKSNHDGKAVNQQLELVNLQSQVSDHQSTMSKLETEISKLRFRNSQLMSEINEKDLELTNQVAENNILETEFQQIQKEAQNYKSQLNSAETRVTELFSELTSVKSQLTNICSSKDAEWIEKLENYKDEWKKSSEKDQLLLKRQLESTEKN